MSIDVPTILGQSPFIQDFGFVASAEVPFSEPCPVVMDATAKRNDPDFDLSKPGDKRFYLDTLPPQFRPPALRAREVFQQRHPNRSLGTCKAYIRQGWLYEGETFDDFGIHIDPFVENYPVSYGTDVEGYMIFDKLSPLVYDQPFKMPPTLQCTQTEINRRLQEIFTQQAILPPRLLGEANHLHGMGPFTVHQSQPAQERTFRTWMFIRFS